MSRRNAVLVAGVLILGIAAGSIAASWQNEPENSTSYKVQGEVRPVCVPRQEKAGAGVVELSDLHPFPAVGKAKEEIAKRSNSVIIPTRAGTIPTMLPLPRLPVRQPIGQGIGETRQNPEREIWHQPVGAATVESEKNSYHTKIAFIGGEGIAFEAKGK